MKKVARERDVKYPIRAVSKLTGVSIDTLRAWERRYGAVTPTRDDRGRLYSEADIARLRLLNQAVSAGHSIGRISALTDHQLEQLAVASAAASGASLAARPPALDHSTFSAALSRFDSVAVDREFARLAAVMSAEDLVQHVLMPTLREVGTLWMRRRDGIAHEHLMSAATHHLLGSFLRLHARPDAPVRLLFATPSGERHEIGILGAAMLAASRGLGISYLGVDLPAAQIVDAVRAADVSVLVIGLTLPNNRPIDRELRTIIRDLPKSVELWVGGAAAEGHSRLLSKRGLALPDFDSYLLQLARLTNRTA